MGVHEDAQEFLNALKDSRTTSFLGKVDEAQRGIAFALAYLEKAQDEVTAGDLAKELRVSTARVAVLLRKMEQKRYIRKYTSKADARRTIVIITPEGRAYAGEKRKQILNKAELLMEKVGKEDLEEFVRIFRLIADALEDQTQ